MQLKTDGVTEKVIDGLNAVEKEGEVLREFLVKEIPGLAGVVGGVGAEMAKFFFRGLAGLVTTDQIPCILGVTPGGGESSGAKQILQRHYEIKNRRVMIKLYEPDIISLREASNALKADGRIKSSPNGKKPSHIPYILIDAPDKDDIADTFNFIRRIYSDAKTPEEREALESIQNYLSNMMGSNLAVPHYGDSPAILHLEERKGDWRVPEKTLYLRLPVVAIRPMHLTGIDMVVETEERRQEQLKGLIRSMASVEKDPSKKNTNRLAQAKFNYLNGTLQAYHVAPVPEWLENYSDVLGEDFNLPQGTPHPMTSLYHQVRRLTEAQDTSRTFRGKRAFDNLDNCMVVGLRDDNRARLPEPLRAMEEENRGRMEEARDYLKRLRG